MPPRQTAPSGNGMADRVTRTAPDRPALSVLVVDDHPLMREGVRSILKARPGFEVVGEADNGVHAVEQARLLRPDVVLMDIEMPDMDGLTAMRAIKAELPGTSVIMFTSFHNTTYLREAITSGASGFLLKGVEPDVLRESVVLVRSGESLLDTKLLAQMLEEMRQSLAEPPAAAAPADTAALGSHNLSALERQVLRGMVDGLTNGEIALQLHYSHGTVKNAVQRIIEKLGVSDRTQAVVRAVREGLVAG